MQSFFLHLLRYIFAKFKCHQNNKRKRSLNRKMFCLCNRKTSGKVKYLWNNRNVAGIFHFTQQRQMHLFNAHSRVHWQKKHNLMHSSRSINSAIYTSSDSKYDSVPLPKHAKVVICGGGVMGAAVAYHLSLQGWGADTVLIDQSR